MELQTTQIQADLIAVFQNVSSVSREYICKNDLNIQAAFDELSLHESPSGFAAFDEALLERFWLIGLDGFGEGTAQERRNAICSATSALLLNAYYNQEIDFLLGDFWSTHRDEFRQAPASIRATLAKGFKRLHEFERLILDVVIKRDDLIAPPNQEHLEAQLIKLAKAMSDVELLEIASADYGAGTDRYADDIRSMLASEDLTCAHKTCHHHTCFEVHEVISLCSHRPDQIGYTPALAILALWAIRNDDFYGEMSNRFGSLDKFFLNRPEEERLIFYRVARFMYETSACWELSAMREDCQAYIPLEI